MAFLTIIFRKYQKGLSKLNTINEICMYCKLMWFCVNILRFRTKLIYGYSLRMISSYITILALFIVASALPPLSRLPVKVTEKGTNVTFATTCLHNGKVQVDKDQEKAQSEKDSHSESIGNVYPGFCLFCFPVYCL